MSELATLPERPLSLVERTANTFGVDPEKLLFTLKATCFRQAPDKPPVSNEQLMALLIVREQYNLNPFTKELFAFDDKRGGIIPYVSIDGWSRIVNEHPQFDGMMFLWDEAQQSITCTIWRKDRSHPTVVTEYMVECKRNTDPWTKSPRRMLRHKSLMQCARLAFGFAGIYDRDEAEAILDAGAGTAVQEVRPASTQRSALQRVLHATQEHFAQPITEVVEEFDPLVSLLGELADAPDREAGEQVLERGNAMLGADDLAQLQLAFEQRFNEEQP